MLMSWFDSRDLKGKRIIFKGKDENNIFIFSDEEEAEEEDPKHMSKERVLEAIRQKKEAIIRLRSQPWSMKRKRRTLKHAFFA